MRSPDATDVERIEGLLRGMPPETEREAHLEGMIRELRSVSPRASHELRERVRTLREPEVRRSLGWRPALVLVPVALAFAGAIILGGDRNSRAGRGGQQDALDRARGAARAAGEGRRRVRRPARERRSPTPHARRSGTSRSSSPCATTAASPTRARKRSARRARSAASSSRRTSRRRAPAGAPISCCASRSAASRTRSRSSPSSARSPASRSRCRTARPTSTGSRSGSTRCGSSSPQVRAQLAQGGLSEVDRLRLELRRQRLQAELNQQTRQRTGIANEVALAEFSLTLQTKRAAAVAGDSRIDGAVGDALEVLSVAAAVGLFLLIVLAPLAVIAVLLLLGRRSLRRREEERLLDQPRPTPTS